MARDGERGRVRPMSDYHSVQPAMPCPEVGMRYGYDIIVSRSVIRGDATTRQRKQILHVPYMLH